MQLRRLIIFCTLFFSILLNFNGTLSSSHLSAVFNVHSDYVRPDHVSPEVWALLEPYFLPPAHPLRSKLDKIFEKERVNANLSSLTRAGFVNVKEGPYSHMVITKHPKLKDVYVKLMVDSSPYTDWKQIKKRVEGAISAKKTITELGYEHLFKVPQKWVYPIPPSCVPAPDAENPKNFVLIAEDMNVCPRTKNYNRWKYSATRELLVALHQVLQIEGLVDSAVAFNIPFSYDGKVALIDLEHHHHWPVPFYKLERYLRPDLQDFWRDLTTK